MIYATQYFGVNVKHASPNAKVHEHLYSEGVQLAMYALAVFSVAQWIYAFVLPWFIKKTSVAVSYAVSQAIASACFISFMFIENPYVLMAVMALIAVNFTTMNSVPFGMNFY